MDQDTTVEGQLGDAHVTPSNPDTAVADAALTLAELEQATGKKFPSKEVALKSIQDTNSYVGKKKEEIIAEVKSSLASNQHLAGIESQLANLQKELWYKDNPDYAPFRKQIDAIGGNPADVVAKEEYKELFEKARGFDENQKLKTVLDTNPRIAVSRDNLAKAKEAQKVGNTDETNAAVAAAVRSAYNF
jgi:hypothetical protein